MHARLSVSALVLSFALISAAGAASAQTSAAEAQQQMQAMQAAQAQANADASHPGDDQLTCDQLQAQMMAAIHDPTAQAAIAQNGAMAQQQMEHARQEEGRPHHQQQQPTQEQLNEAHQQTATMANNTMSMLPSMTRGQHLYQLAQRKNCAFVQQYSQQH